MVAGSAIHTLWAAKGVALKYCSGQGPPCASLVAELKSHWSLVTVQGEIPGHVGALLLAILVVLGRTRYPRWTVVANPAILIAAASFTYLVPAPAGAMLVGGGIHLSIAVFFAVSVAATWTRAELDGHLDRAHASVRAWRRSCIYRAARMPSHPFNAVSQEPVAARSMSNLAKFVAWFALMDGLLTLGILGIAFARDSSLSAWTSATWSAVGAVGVIAGICAIRARRWAFWLPCGLYLIQVVDYWSPRLYLSFMGLVVVDFGWGSQSPPSHFDINLFAIAACVFTYICSRGLAVPSGGSAARD